MINLAFLTQFAPLQRGKVRTTLERQMRLNGHYLFRWQAAQELAALPTVRYDAEKGRLYTDENTFFVESNLTATLVQYVLWLRVHEPVA